MTKLAKKLPYREGDWFTFSLPSAGHIVGRIARLDRQGVVLAYFFELKTTHMPELKDVAGLRAKDALIVLRASDLGLLQGKWRLLGQSEPWVRTDWPLPRFFRRDVISGNYWQIDYDENAGLIIAEKKLPGLPPARYARDGMYGYVAVEEVICQLLRRESPW